MENFIWLYQSPITEATHQLASQSVLSGHSIQQKVQSATYGINLKTNLNEPQALTSL